jgi:hypothetical protein
MQTPIPPLITADSHNSKSKMSLLTPFSNLTLPEYSSTNDVINPIPGMLIYVSGSLVVYNGSNWETITVSGGTWTQQGSKLVGTGYVGTDIEQGYSVALSADGNTLAIGGPSDDFGIGAIWIFTRSAGVWTQQGPKLVGTGYIGSPFQGSSISLSDDGNTLAIGSLFDDTNIGATWIFTRTAGVWSQQGPKLVGTGYVGPYVYQGYSVALSADGNTLAVGGYSDDSFVGATWIFTRTAGVWSQQGSKLVGTGYIGVSAQGTSVALSDDGNTLAVGGPNDDTNIGATWIFTRSAGVWSQQGSKLIGTGYVAPDVYQGQSVSLSADGDTLAIGGYGDDNFIGAVWIFTRSAGVWTQQGTKLVGTGYVGSDINQGQSVSLSADGNTLAVGGLYDDNAIGATWIFTRTAGVWTQQGPKLVGTGYVGIDIEQGVSVSLSADGNTLAVGGYFDDDGNTTYIGATWIFTRS